MGIWKRVWGGNPEYRPQGGEQLLTFKGWWLGNIDEELYLIFGEESKYPRYYADAKILLSMNFTFNPNKSYKVEAEWKIGSSWGDIPYTWGWYTIVYLEPNEKVGKFVACTKGMNRLFTSSQYYNVYEYEPEPPSMPSSITVPPKVKEGEKISISWGTGSLATSYRLELSINGGSYTQIYSGSSRSYTDTALPSWDTVRYRVRAYNSDGYSSYRTSDVVQIIHFPSLGIKTNGNLKESDMGWVKINGELKEIDTIHTKINGVFKEVD